MATRVKTIELWRAEIENKPGTLAGVLEPLQAVGLQVVMGYRPKEVKVKTFAECAIRAYTWAGSP